MNKHKALALQALINIKGDNLYRARAAFRNMTLEQMNQQYGQSGSTRAEIIAEVCCSYGMGNSTRRRLA